MKIRIAASVYDDIRYFAIIDSIMVLLEEQRHVLAYENIDELIGSEWARQREGSVEFLKKGAVTNSFDPYEAVSTVIIDVNAPRGGRWAAKKNVTEVRPAEALIFLCTPFQVIVENEEFDGGFILWCARAIGFTRLIDAYRAGRFTFRHAGGKGSICRSARIFCGGIWARADGRYAKSMGMWLCAFLDSDSRYPGHRPNNDLLAELLPLVSFFHQLARRSIESYLPRGSLLQLLVAQKDRQRIDAYFRLNELQRMHYCMKRGFKLGADIPMRQHYSSSPSIHSDEKQLYAALSDTDWNILAVGFGSSLSKIYIHDNYRPVQGRGLDSAVDIAEIEDLVKKIYRAI